MARRFDAAVLHDFFVDRLVHVKSIEGLTSSINAKAEQGGGGIHGVAQEEVSGGNAVNLARAMARLGLRVLLITHSDNAHEGLLRRAFEGTHAEIRVKPLPPGLTVAIEGRENVMLGECGGARRFGPSLLGYDDWSAMARADLVCSVNWAANESGTELLRAIRSRLGRRKAIYFDPADFRDRSPQFGLLLKEASEKGLFDWVSMNEWEATAAAELMHIGTGSLGQTCKALAAKLDVAFDLHGVDESYASDGMVLSSSRCTKIRSRRLTGAGDAWDAAAIYGKLNGMGEARRLRFANAAARVYLQREELLPPTAEEVEARL